MDKEEEIRVLVEESGIGDAIDWLKGEMQARNLDDGCGIAVAMMLSCSLVINELTHYYYVKSKLEKQFPTKIG